MTSHPQRCETCIKKECEMHPKQRSISYMGSPISDIVHDFTSRHGCASHSSKTPASAAPEKCDWDEPKGMCSECEYYRAKPCDHCDFQEREDYIHSLESQIATIHNQTLSKLDANEKTEAFLRWVADRLEYVYKDNPRMDFIIELRRKADVIESLRTPSTHEHQRGDKR